MKQQRIEYIDLMKGICMIMVILLHCGFFKNGANAHIFSYISNFFMPLYFFISGLFYKTNENFKNLITKKTNTLIIPYFFFSTILFIPHIWVNPYTQEVCSWQYFFFGFIEPYNYPLWFLRCLFFVYILYFLLCKITSNIKYRIIFSFTISCSIWFITPFVKSSFPSYLEWTLVHQNILTALFVLPYFSLANYLRHKNFLKWNISNTKKTIAFFISLTILIFFKTDNIDLPHAFFSNYLISFYISSLAGIFTVLFFSSIIQRLFYITYIGRYSIIALGVHVIIILIIKGLPLNLSSWQLSLIVLTLCPLFIYVFSKYFPYFTAQKNLIRTPHDRQ